MAEAMERAQVLDWSLQQQLVPYMRDIVPLPGTHGLCMGIKRQGLGGRGVLRPGLCQLTGWKVLWERVHEPLFTTCGQRHALELDGGDGSRVHIEFSIRTRGS